jgi:putative ABC transport system ATP-binding protein
MTLVQLEAVSKTYGEGAIAVHALKDVTLSIESGSFVVLLGPSGSGKTTLLNLIGGIEEATAGRIRVAGVELSGLGGDQLTEYRRTAVGFVFQFFNLVPTLTAQENVELVAELGGPGAAARSQAALSAVGLADRADHFPGSMSGGQQQRVAIARAVVKAPPLLLCDEPTGSLDLDTGRQVLADLRLHVSDGRTVLLVTHNAAIARMADRVIHLGSGRVVGDEPVTDPLPAELVAW